MQHKHAVFAARCIILFTMIEANCSRGVISKPTGLSTGVVIGPDLNCGTNDRGDSTQSPGSTRNFFYAGRFRHSLTVIHRRQRAGHYLQKKEMGVGRCIKGPRRVVSSQFSPLHRPSVDPDYTPSSLFNPHRLYPTLDDKAKTKLEGVEWRAKV